MDRSKPVAKRTRQSEALYFKELHKRIKLVRSGGLEAGSESEVSVAGGLVNRSSGSGGSEVGRKKKSACRRNGKIEVKSKAILVSDDSDHDDVVVVEEEESSVDRLGVAAEEVVDDGGNVKGLGNRMGGGLKAGEDVVLIYKECVKKEGADCEMSSVVEGKEVGSNGDVEELVDDEGVDMSASSNRIVSGLKVGDDVVVISEDDVNEEEGDDVGLVEKAKLEGGDNIALISSGDGNGIGIGEPADDVDSDQLSDSDYEKNELSGEVDYCGSDDDGWDFIERGSPSKNIVPKENVDDSGVLKTGSPDSDTQQSCSTTKKGVKFKNNIHFEWVETSKKILPEVIYTSKSCSKAKTIDDGGLSLPLEVEEEDDDYSMPKRRRMGFNTVLKQSSQPKKFRVLKDLVESMLNDNEEALEESASQQSSVSSNTKEPLPLKFTFGVPATSPPQKSEFEKELDELWDEFDSALTVSEISSAAIKMVNQKVDTTPELDTNHPRPYCLNGQHVFTTDEEIGIKCKYCSFVKLEIRHSMPSFSKYPYGLSLKKRTQDDDDDGNISFNEIPFEHVACSSDIEHHYYTKGTVWDLIPNIQNGMHPHQKEGFEFIWKNIAGGIYLNELQKQTCTDNGNGCIISHAPGTGKSRLTIAFLQTYMKLYPACRPVLIAPCSMLLTWEAELRKWKVGVPFHNLNVADLSGKENAAAINLLGRANRDINSMRLLKLYSWKKDGGLLGLSYKLYERLAGDKRVEKHSKVRSKSCQYDLEFQKTLLETPNLLVLDEGHTPRNSKSLIWKALCKIQTEKRIILSGTPFQNNFEELFNTLCLVRPKFADSIQPGWYSRRRGPLRKVSAAKGNFLNLTNPIGKFEEGRVSDIMLEELRDMLNSFVHIYKGNILQKSLPGLRDSVIVLRPAEFQKSILEGIYRMRSHLERNYVTSLVSLHPSMLPVSERVHFPLDRHKLEELRFNPEAGVKTKFLIKLIKLTEATKEKVLVFSEYVEPLNFIREMLKSYFGWAEGEEILYMDGKIDVKQRQLSINTFNDLSSKARVLLASKKACGEGISLVGASRVVLLDVVWNPSVERQAISRAYRLGQKRVVHVYQLISGPLEWEKYCLQSKKNLLSELVFSATDKEDNSHVISKGVCGDSILEEMAQHSSFKDMVEKIIYQPKESSLVETFGLVDQEAQL